MNKESATIRQLLNQIEGIRQTMPTRCRFDESMGFDAVMEFIDEHPFTFPQSYLEFLMQFDGGFICSEALAACADEAAMAWNSNCFLGLSEIDAAYDRVSYKFHPEGPLFIPFLRTPTSEYLAFRFPFDGAESPVYDIWHEAFPSEWLTQQVYPDFNTLLTEYLAQDGQIETIG